MSSSEQASFLEKIMAGSQTPKILLVDDEPDVLMLTGFTLTRAGYSIIKAESGKQALEMYEAEKPVLVILDRMMPEMDGLEVCRQLRERDDELYIMILTALDTDSDRIMGFEAGADDYMGKPINFKELVLRVRTRMRRVKLAENQRPPELPTSSSDEAEPAPLTEAERLENLLLDASRAAQAHDMDHARELYQEALGKEPQNPVALKWLAYHTSDPNEGCYFLERLIEVQPENLKARRLLEIGRRRCQEIDQQAFNNLLRSLHEPTPVVEETPATPARRPIGQLLVERGYITQENIETATTLQEMFRRTGAPKKLGEILIEYGVLSEEQLKRVLAEQESQNYNQIS